MRALFAAILLGCANRNDATTTTTCGPTRVDCPNERAAPLVAECDDAAHDSACGTAYQRYFRCRQLKQLCDGRGRLDEDASVAACATEHAAWTSCSGDAKVDAKAD